MQFAFCDSTRVFPFLLDPAFHAAKADTMKDCPVGFDAVWQHKDVFYKCEYGHQECTFERVGGMLTGEIYNAQNGLYRVVDDCAVLVPLQLNYLIDEEKPHGLALYTSGTKERKTPLRVPFWNGLLHGEMVFPEPLRRAWAAYWWLPPVGAATTEKKSVLKLRSGWWFLDKPCFSEAEYNDKLAQWRAVAAGQVYAGTSSVLVLPLCRLVVSYLM